MGLNTPAISVRNYQLDFDVLLKGSDAILKPVVRYVSIALPFAALYQPTAYPLNLFLNGCRSIDCLAKLAGHWVENGEPRGDHFIKTALSLTSIAAVYFEHPMAMAVISLCDLISELQSFYQHLEKGSYRAIVENAINLMTQVLYLAFLFNGGLELSIALLVCSMIQNGYQAFQNISQEDPKYPEAIGNILMAMVRAYQLKTQLSLLKPKKEEKPIPNFSEELIKVFEKYEAETKERDMHISTLIAEKGDTESMSLLLLSGYQCNPNVLATALDAKQYAMANFLLDNKASIDANRAISFMIDISSLETDVAVTQKLAMIEKLIVNNFIPLRSYDYSALSYILQVLPDTAVQASYKQQLVDMLLARGALLTGKL